MCTVVMASDQRHAQASRDRSQRTPVGGATRPTLTAALMARLRAYGSAESVAAGDLIYQPGDDNHDLVLIESGRIALYCDQSAGQPALVIAEMGPGDFLGEISLYTGERMFITARALDRGVIYRVSTEAFRQLMSRDTELSDVILTALYQRRGLLKTALADTIEIIDRHDSAAAMTLVTYAERMQLPFRFIEAASSRGTALIGNLDLQPADLPAVLLPDALLLAATPAQLARHLTLTPSAIATETVDLVVIGGGPAGLSATVYGASEGLRTIMFDAVAPGGQAAASARIENYPGFPNGLSGAELTQRATIQALKFGARLYAPYRVVSLAANPGEPIELKLDDDSTITTRTVILATGAHYKSLPLPRWHEFEGRGLYYAATELEARHCGQAPVTIVGGANSAGQAALFLSERCGRVTLIIRGDDVRSDMSAYLVDRITGHPMITIITESEVTALHGTEHLESISVTKRPNGFTTTIECTALFCLIGALPDTQWLPELSADTNGFIYTDTQVSDEHLGSRWSALSRRPLPFETSMPGVFAVGDVRNGSMKRVAAAVGEGASAVASAYAALNPPAQSK